MFMSEYNHTIDIKGRLIVPAKFRKELGDTFIVTKGFDECLLAYPKSEWTLFEEKLLQLPQNNKNARALVRHFMAGAVECEIDKQGRILIPQVLRNFAKLNKDVLLVGVGTKIEIWDKDIWEQNETNDIEQIAESLEEFNIRL